MNGHLGEQVAAFVDGQLDYGRREKALEHLSRCPECRAAVDQQRLVKARVQTLPGAEPSAGLLSALTAVSVEPSRLLPEPCPHRRPLETRAGRSGLVLAGAGSVAAGVLGLAYVVGGASPAERAPVSPPVGQFAAEFAGAEQAVPLSDPAMDTFSLIGDRAPMGGP